MYWMFSFCFAALECRVWNHKQLALAKHTQHVRVVIVLRTIPEKRAQGVHPRPRMMREHKLIKRPHATSPGHSSCCCVDMFWIETRKIGTNIYVHILRYFHGCVHKFEKDHVYTWKVGMPLCVTCASVVRHFLWRAAKSIPTEWFL
jgi:hypothetical protein